METLQVFVTLVSLAMSCVILAAAEPLLCDPSLPLLDPISPILNISLCVSLPIIPPNQPPPVYGAPLTSSSSMDMDPLERAFEKRPATVYGPPLSESGEPLTDLSEAMLEDPRSATY